MEDPRELDIDFTRVLEDWPAAPFAARREVDVARCRAVVSTFFFNKELTPDCPAEQFVAWLDGVRALLRAADTMGLDGAWHAEPEWEFLEEMNHVISIAEAHIDGALEFLLTIETLRRDTSTGVDSDEAAAAIAAFDVQLGISARQRAVIDRLGEKHGLVRILRPPGVQEDLAELALHNGVLLARGNGIDNEYAVVTTSGAVIRVAPGITIDDGDPRYVGIMGGDPPFPWWNKSARIPHRWD